MAVGNLDSTINPSLNGSATANDLSTLGRKRKSPGGSAQLDHLEAIGSPLDHGLKKIKLIHGDENQGAQSSATAGNSVTLDKSLLCPAIWHHVFTFCPPKSLGHLLAVSKAFNFFLDPASPFRREARGFGPPGALRAMEPNAIWRASRRLFWPQMPAPLRSKTELDMWRLACSPRCQYCGRLHVQGQTASPKPSNPGPGAEGVAAIWAFGTRLCTPCLLKNTDKVRELIK